MNSKQESVEVLTDVQCVPVNVKIDPDVPVSIMTYTVAQRAGGPILPLSLETKRYIRTTFEDHSSITKYTQAMVYLGGTKYSQRFFVLSYRDGERFNSGTADIVMGNDFITKVGPLHIDYDKQEAFLLDKKNGIQYRFPLEEEESPTLVRQRDKQPFPTEIDDDSKTNV